MRDCTNLNKRSIITREFYLIEVDTLKSFFEKKSNKNSQNISFEPCPEVKKQEILDKAKGKKRKNAEWFLSLQLDMFGDKKEDDTPAECDREISFSILNEKEGVVLVNGIVANNSLISIEKNPSGSFLAVISDDSFKDDYQDVFFEINRHFADKKHSSKGG